MTVLTVLCTEIWLGSWTEKDAEAQRDTLPTFFGVYFGVGSLAWVAFGAACLYLFLRIAVRTAFIFHNMLLKTMLKYV
jgi:hypothetical protein